MTRKMKRSKIGKVPTAYPNLTVLRPLDTMLHDNFHMSYCFLVARFHQELGLHVVAKGSSSSSFRQLDKRKQ